jgi:hypothetical protein
VDGSKAWYASSGVWGGVLAVAAPIASVVLKVSIGGDEIALAAEALAAIGGGVGGLVAIYGRVKAKDRIG